MYNVTGTLPWTKLITAITVRVIAIGCSATYLARDGVIDAGDLSRAFPLDAGAGVARPIRLGTCPSNNAHDAECSSKVLQHASAAPSSRSSGCRSHSCTTPHFVHVRPSESNASTSLHSGQTLPLALSAQLSDSLLALRLSVGSGKARRGLFLNGSSELLDVERSLLHGTRAGTGATGSVCGVRKRSDGTLYERVLKAIPFARRSTQQ
jgi:hypothetical protein